jgi:hypothetical protein
MKKLAVILACALLFSIGGTYATWKYTTGITEPKSIDVSISLNDFYYPPEMVYITDVKYKSGSGNYSNLSHFESTLTSTVNVPSGTDVTFLITVFNNTNVEQGFDAVLSNLGVDGVGSGYDNANVGYTLTNLKRPYLVDNVPQSDATRIPAQKSHVFEITFKLTKNSTNTTLNSSLNFVFKPYNEIDPERFTSPIDGALDAFKKILNTPEDRAKLDSVLKNNSSSSGNYVGNVVGSGETDSKVLNELFAGNLNLMLQDTNGNLVKTNLTCMIKQQDLTGDGIVEMTIYMTPDNLEEVGLYRTIDNVYAAVFTQVVQADGNPKWVQLGELYRGTATCNDYNGRILPRDPAYSLNTDSWKSSAVYHGVRKNSSISAVITGYKNSQN